MKLHPFAHRQRAIRLAIACLLLLAAPLATADERQWKAPGLSEEALLSGVHLSKDGSCLELDRGELIEDDGPAAGYSYQPNEEKLSDRVWIKKQLLVDDPRADRALLLVGPGGELTFHINGISLDLQPSGKAGEYWQTYEVPTTCLKPGLNEIILHGAGKVWIARDDEYAAGSLTRTRHPNRSAKSTDGGKTWNDQHLGTKDSVDGEYYVRLFLERYQREGTLTLPVVDLGNLNAEKIAPFLSSLSPVRIAIESESGSQGNVHVKVRSGPTPVPNDAWSDWQPLAAEGVYEKPVGRYLEVQVTLKTSDPQESPKLRGVKISAEPQVAVGWTDRLTVIESRNERIVRSSVPFSYEPFDHPRLNELRKTQSLDAVTTGATSEFELIKRLAAWAAMRWKGPSHLGQAYPPWDANEILKTHTDGTPVGGFCQQYNVLLLQACESYGIPGRAVSLGPGPYRSTIRSGHEVVELWSNEFKKWIYVDGNYAWYFADETTGTPLSLRELRTRQLAALREEPHSVPRVVRLVETPQPWDGLKSMPPFVELRLIPRSNFLEAAAPLPLNQGMRGWFWTGHYAWSDDSLPAPPLYGHRVNSAGNWDWTLNQAHLVLEAADKAGELRVHLVTETPQFETFLIEIDDGQKEPANSGFLWKLHTGTNRLQVRPRNRAGREGIASSITLQFRK